LLRNTGARQVDGVDVSEAAISRARELFAGDGIAFHCADATKLDELFDDGTFDVVVSLETIEHVPDADAFLRAVKRVAKSTATIIISCPNDHWYYPSNEIANPYHVRKYTFSEFKKIAGSILGDNVVWGLGTAALGFATMPVVENGSVGWERIAERTWMSYRRQTSAMMVPGMIGDPVGVENCSYFVGVWGPVRGADLFSSAVFPLSMNGYVRCIDALTGSRSDAEKVELAEIQQRMLDTTERMEGLERDVAKFRLQAAALVAENEVLRKSLAGALAAPKPVAGEPPQDKAQQAQLLEAARRYHALAGFLKRVTPKWMIPAFRRAARRFTK
jgi:hypothetical protein